MIRVKKIIRTGLNRKGLVWTTDFITGLILFIVIILISVKILIGIPVSQDHVIVYRDAVYLSDNLLSEGYPANWTNESVILPGIAENNRINTARLSEFQAMDYYRAKTLLHVTSDFVFFIRNATDIINISGCTYGYNLTHDANCTPLFTGISYENLVRVDRIILYNSTVMTMTIYTWD